jgi:uncharacterized protein YpmB
MIKKMEKQFLPFTAPSWLKWGMATFIILLLLVIGYGIYLYNDVLQSKTEGFVESKQKALSETALSEIDDVSRYQGELFYHVVRGTMKNHESAIAFIPVNKEEPIQFFITNDLLKKEDIMNQWRTSCSKCKWIDTAIAIHNEKPLWEITYIDSSNRYVLEYLYMDSGEVYEQIRLKQS